jgi:hypothetical protein
MVEHPFFHVLSEDIKVFSRPRDRENFTCTWEVTSLIAEGAHVLISQIERRLNMKEILLYLFLMPL